MSTELSGVDRNRHDGFVHVLPSGRTELHVNHRTRIFELHAAPDYTDEDVDEGLECAETHGLEYIDPERHKCYVRDLPDGGAIFQLMPTDVWAYDI